MTNHIFGTAEQASSYHNSPITFMPGYADVQRMALILLQEKTSHHARILVHGAGTGSEIAFFAQQNPSWYLHGIDPAPAMLAQAQQNTQHETSRITLQCGYIDEVKERDFSGATSLLTMHFLSPDERLHNLKQIVQRLVPGAPLVLAHCSVTQEHAERQRIFDRHAAFRRSHGVSDEQVQQGREQLDNLLHILSPEQDIELLREAGLHNISEFYSAFTWRGWVGYV